MLATPLLMSPISMCTVHTAETKGGRHNTVGTGIQIKISTKIRGLSKDPDPDLDSGSFGKMPKKTEWCIADPGEPY